MTRANELLHAGLNSEYNWKAREELVVEVGVDVWGVKMALWNRKAARLEARAAWKGCVGSMNEGGSMR
jgi:hypothetical protein